MKLHSLSFLTQTRRCAVRLSLAALGKSHPEVNHLCQMSNGLTETEILEQIKQFVPGGQEYYEKVRFRGWASQSVKFFSKLNEFIFGYFDPINNFFDNKYK